MPSVIFSFNNNKLYACRGWSSNYDRSKVHEQDIQKMGQIILNPVNRKHPIILTFDTNKYDFELWLQMIWGLDCLRISVPDTITLFEKALKEENAMTYFEEEIYSDEETQKNQLFRIVIDDEIGLTEKEYRTKRSREYLSLTLDANHKNTVLEWDFYKNKFWDIPIISQEGIILFFQDIAMDIGEQFSSGTMAQFTQLITTIRKELSENKPVSFGFKDPSNFNRWEVNILEVPDGGYQVKTHKMFRIPRENSLINHINEI